MLSDVIENLKRALQPDRELDRAIALACGWRQQEAQFVGHQWISPAEQTTGLPYFTVSIDAALLLIDGPAEPDGVRWKVGHDSDGAFYAQCNGPRIVEGATPAIALCIAALAARERGHHG